MKQSLPDLMKYCVQLGKRIASKRDFAGIVAGRSP
jgi:hypothetical protein